MRVLLQVDMEGAALLTDFRELFPVWPEYWQRGREHLTVDVVAAVEGLLAGGASQVVVDDQHLGFGVNVLVEQLPAGAVLAERHSLYQQLPARPFDAVFQLGRHARQGTADGFVAHTMVPDMALAVDGRSITESHIFAWRAGVPVIGITGDDRLGDQLAEQLAGAPFLAVKHSIGPLETRPAFPNPTSAARAIRAFAADCARRAAQQPVPTLPARFTLSASVAPELAEELAGQARWVRRDATELSATCSGWWEGAEAAMQAVIHGAGARYYRALGPLDLSSEATALANDSDLLSDARHLITAWLRAEPLATV